VKRTLVFLIIVSSALAFARGKRVIITVWASTTVGGMSSGDECAGKGCHPSRVSAHSANEIAIAAEIDGQHVILYCNNATESRCVRLRPGEYKGEMKDNSVLIKDLRLEDKKAKPVRYEIR
jgi:hypothetical protein